MRRPTLVASRTQSLCLRSLLSVLVASACTSPPPSFTSASVQSGQGTQEQIARGRFLVVSHACGDCHGGGSNPAAAGWLDGMRDTTIGAFHVGPFVTRARNLTPDNATGLGRFSERQIFNALRYGLRPGETPDVVTTGITPGQGNFPQN